LKEADFALVSLLEEWLVKYVYVTVTNYKYSILGFA